MQKYKQFLNQQIKIEKKWDHHLLTVIKP